ncbi:MAG: cation transporter, partial [Actinomycetota bacterium]|nr:cation transporter [Actinomycetota bacterium]
LGVPLAVTGLVHPAWAMAAMIASVTTVLTNSFAGRLLPKGRRRKTPRRESRLTLKVTNMRCEHCLESIREAACKLEGVEDVSGDLEEHGVTVTYREGVAEPDGIREAIVERGFQIDGVGPASERVGEKAA